MKHLLILTALFLIVQDAFSQSNQSSEINRFVDEFRRERSSGSAIDQSRYETIAGSPYMAEEFAEGEVIINDSIRHGKVPLRYNIFTDKMEFKNRHDQFMEVDYSAGQFSFLLNAHQFEVLEYKDKGKSQNGHLELLVDGKIRLYRKYNMLFEKATKVRGFETALPDRFVMQDPTFLIAIADEVPETISKRKDLLQKLNQDDPKVEQYLNDNKLRMKSEASLVDLITFYNKSVANP